MQRVCNFESNPLSVKYQLITKLTQPRQTNEIRKQTQPEVFKSIVFSSHSAIYNFAR